MSLLGRFWSLEAGRNLGVAVAVVGLAAWQLRRLSRKLLSLQASSDDHRGAAQARPPRGSPQKEPSHLLCPVTQVLFRDPVFVIDSGNTYEREAVLGFWRHAGEPKDPLTNMRLESREVRTNWAVRREVSDFLDAHPGYVPEGWDSRELLPPDKPNVVPETPEEAEGWRNPAGAAQPEEIDGIPAGIHAHVAAVAQAHGGWLPAPILQHLAQTLGADRDALQRAFGREERPGPGPGPAPADAAPEARADGVPGAAGLPATVRLHCDAIARAMGGTLPEPLLRQLAGALGVDEAALRAAYPPAPG
ncbi:unnamed protein product [Polarella glacialis]|uniref:U-box domain-containing protein n=1 Tax=Polarella glacialis TaxID=89957 RepID=A0A813LPY9_POLGL|nr:unnamed protein product [Polarella glacialis]CAE8729235.1 unnamed protein product [Polarella glacialis]